MDPVTDYHQLAPDEVRRKIDGGEAIVLVDVRTAPEYDARHIPGAILIPLDELVARCCLLGKSEQIVCICEHGIRSEMAAAYLASCGYGCAATMVGGMVGYPGITESRDA